MISGGVGTNRALPHQGEVGRFRVLCATTSGYCDAGVPLIVLDDVYASIENPLAENHGILVDLKGTLVELPELVLPARGAVLSQPLYDFLSSSLHVPRYCVLVESSLQVREYISDFRLRASAWTLYVRETKGRIQPSFTYATFDPQDEFSLEEAGEFVRTYVRDHDGTVTYTDFDEHVRRLDSKYPLSKVFVSSVAGAEEDLKKLASWGDSLGGFA